MRDGTGVHGEVPADQPLTAPAVRPVTKARRRCESEGELASSGWSAVPPAVELEPVRLEEVVRDQQITLGLIAVLANITALERIYSVYKVARGVPLDAPLPAPNREAKKG